MKRDAFNAALQNGAYAWPGGYPLRFIMKDGESVCFDCAERNADRIREEIADAPDGDSDWSPVAAAIHWEGAAEICANCNADIESAYGESE